MTKLCPECGHELSRHNDAGTIRGGQGEMRCYHPNEGTQFLPSGEPNVCGCSYSGPGTTVYGDTSPTQAQVNLRKLGLLD